MGAAGCASQKRLGRTRSATRTHQSGTATRPSGTSAKQDQTGCDKYCPVPIAQLGGYLDIVGRGAAPPVPYLVGDTAVLRGGRSVRLPGAQDAAISADGRYLAYADGSPAVRIVDLADGARSRLAHDAAAPAWGSHGQLAYIQGVGLATYQRLVYIHVRSHVGAKPVVWGRAANWESLQWLGNQLLATSAGGLRLFASPTDSRPLPAGRASAGALGSLIAASPDGREVLVNIQTLGPGGSGQGSSDRADLVRVSDGQILGSTVVSRPGTAAAALGPGDWRGDTVVSPNAIFSGGAAPSYPPGLALLSVTRDRVRVRWFRPLLVNRDPFMGQNKAFSYTPTFVGRGTSRVELWVAAIASLRYVVCDLGNGRCAWSRDLFRGQSVYLPASFLTASAG
jgi:hypothetical protein